MLFRFLHFERPRKLTTTQKDALFSGGVVDEVNGNLGVSGDESPFSKSLNGASDQTIGKLAQFGWTFTIGLATMVNTGILPRMSVEEIVGQLQELGMVLHKAFLEGQ